MQKGSVLKVVVLVVAIVVIVLALWMSNNKDTMMSTVNPSSNPKVSYKPSGPMSAEELFKTGPGPNATQEEQVSQYQRISASAVVASFVDVSNCLAPSPSVAKVNSGSSITFRNNDSMSHRLFNGTLGNIDVPAKGAYQYKVNGQGALGYTCDGKLTGILFVVK